MIIKTSRFTDSDSSTEKLIRLKRIIIVDDDDDFAESISEILESKKYLIKTTNNKDEAIEINREFKADIAILDIKLGQNNGVELISHLRESNPSILCIMLTGYANIETAISALREGAYDYLTKPVHPEHLLSKIQRGFEKIELENHKTSSIEALRTSEERHRRIINNMVEGVITLEESGKIISFNIAAEGIFNCSAVNTIGENINTLLYLENDNDNNFIKHYITKPGSKPVIHEINARRNHKQSFPLRFSISELPLSNSNTRQLIFSCTDITQHKMNEDILRQSEKMKALGILTGGIAHDYNNMLGIINGYAELLEDALKDQPALRKYAEEIYHAGQRSARLTQRLLAFSKQKPQEESILDLNTLLLDQQSLLEKILTARITLVYNLCTHLWPVWLDSNDLEDVILNIIINAMHSIHDRGQITIVTNNKQLDTFDAKAIDLPPGDYVTFSISDTGCGIDTENKERIFDPFFSTKGEMGTGLGLSQVYGFVSRSQGKIIVNSEVNKGSEFVLYFPRHLNS